MVTTPAYESDGLVLALFESPGETPTPTAGVKAWLALDTVTRRPLLIKRLTEGASGTGLRKARATEALALVHPGVVRTRRWIAEGGHLYVVRDVVRGKNLRQALTTSTSEKPNPELLRLILLPLFETLSYTHGQGVTHGGISAENVLVTDEGRILLSDFATADPRAPRHQPNYNGVATVAGDIKALGSILTAYLPDSGAFAQPAIRNRIAGLINRCDTLDDLKEIVNSLEKLAVAPIARPKDGVPASVTAPNISGLPPLEMPTLLGAVPTPDDEPSPPATEPPPVTVTIQAGGLRIPQGGGGIISVSLRNDAPHPIALRMIATQHSWLNTRPFPLPKTLAVSSSETIEFSVSAARLTPGEYRSEVYFTIVRPHEYSELSMAGVFKHAAEVRVTVEAPPLPGVPVPGLPGAASPATPGSNPPYPAHAAKVAAGPGCLPALLLWLPLLLLSRR